MPGEESDSDSAGINSPTDFGEYLVRRNLKLLVVNPTTGEPDPFGLRVAEAMEEHCREFGALGEVHDALDFRNTYLLRPDELHPVRTLVEAAAKFFLFYQYDAKHYKTECREIREKATTAIQSKVLRGLDREPYSATIPDFCLWLVDRYQVRELTWIVVFFKHLAESVASADSPPPAESAVSSTAESIAAQLRVTSWKQVHARVTLDGIRFKRLGAAGRGRLYAWEVFGLEKSKKGQSLLIELAQSGVDGIAGDSSAGRRSLVHKINQGVGSASGLGRCVGNEGGFRTHALFGLLEWDGGNRIETIRAPEDQLNDETRELFEAANERVSERQRWDQSH